MTTNNAVNVGLAGSTGTGNFVGANTPTLITPVLGAATATSLSFGATATNGIIGVDGTTNAASGVVGELLSSVITSASATNYGASGNVVNLTSLNLTAGSWLLFGQIGLTPATAVTEITGGFSPTSTTAANAELRTIIFPLATSVTINVPVPMQQINVTATTPYYLTLFATYTGASATMYGAMYALRIR